MKKANFTVEYESDEQIYHFELFLKQQIKVTDFTLLPDTKELYEKDHNFRQICMKVKAAKRSRNDYINKHNFK